MSSRGWKDLSSIKKAFTLFRVTKPNPRELTGVNRTWFSVFLTISELGGIVWWYYLLLGLTEIPTDPEVLVKRIQWQVTKNPFDWLFILFPLLIIPHIYFGLKNTIKGETFTFDSLQGLLLKNGYPLVPFVDIQEVQIRPIFIGGSRHRNYPYRLTVVSANGKKIKIIHMGWEGNIAELANDIAEMAKVEVKKSGFALF